MKEFTFPKKINEGFNGVISHIELTPEIITKLSELFEVAEIFNKREKELQKLLPINVTFQFFGNYDFLKISEVSQFFVSNE